MAYPSDNKQIFSGKITPLLIIFFITCPGIQAGPRQLNPKNPSELLLEQALKGLNMNEYDLWLSHDAVPRDSFRLPVIDSLFEDPLMGFRLPEQLNLRRSEENSLRIHSLVEILNLKKREWPLDSSLKKEAGAILTTHQRKELEKQIFWNSWGSEIIKCLNTSMALKSAQKLYSKAVLKSITGHFDSLLLMNDKAEEMNVYQIKEAENRQRKQAVKLFETADKITVSDFTRHGERLYRQLLEKVRSESSPFRGDKTIREFKTAQGIIAVGTRNDDVYTENYLLIIDPGGDDTYLIKGRSPEQVLEQPLTVILDLGGDDLYRGGDYTFGGGIFRSFHSD